MVENKIDTNKMNNEVKSSLETYYHIEFGHQQILIER